SKVFTTAPVAGLTVWIAMPLLGEALPAGAGMSDQLVRGPRRGSGATERLLFVIVRRVTLPRRGIAALVRDTSYPAAAWLAGPVRSGPRPGPVRHAVPRARAGGRGASRGARRR